MKPLAIYLVVLFFSFITKGQEAASSFTRKNDSLQKILATAPNDTTRCFIVNAMIEAEGDDDVWPLFNLQLKELAETSLKKIGDKTNSHENPEYITYKKYLAGAINNIGYISQLRGNIPGALENYSKSLKIEQEISDKVGMATTLNNIARIYQDQGNIQKALEYSHKCLSLMEELKNKEGIAGSLGNIGVIYVQQGDISKALEYYEKALKIDEELQNKNGLAFSFNNIGDIYRTKGNTTKALEYFFKSLALREEMHDKLNTARVLNNIGTTYRQMKDYTRALSYFKKSLAIKEEINDKNGLTYSLNSIAAILMQEGKEKEALRLSLLSLDISKELGFPAQIRNAAEICYGIYKKQKKSGEALKMLLLFMTMRDSINNAETRKASTRQQFKYEYEKRELSIKAEQEKKDIVHADQSKRQKIVIWAVISGLLLVIIFLVFLFNRFKLIKQQKKIIERQKKKVDDAFSALHEKNQEVTDSIIYARRIQHSLLTTEKYIDKQLQRLKSSNEANATP